MGISHKLIETDVTLIADYIQANIVAALAEVTFDNVKKIPLPKPTNVFAYEPVSVFRPPAIIVTPDEVDFRLGDKGANFIDAVSRIMVVAVVEEREGPTLQFAAYRYQAALHKLLAQTHLYTADNSVHIVCKIERMRFSTVYTNAQKKDDPQGTFRKEVLLELDVEHYENLT